MHSCQPGGRPLWRVAAYDQEVPCHSVQA
ncbi:hypothetical protein COLE_00927 [Cutaneotrichosporon oleaginosum]|nr:hypothetical protein COLE_00927 [Cutaneotrichosporon oleaginosum]